MHFFVLKIACKNSDDCIIILTMKKLKELFKIFITMFKIGLFTFGGGYAMIAIIEKELVEKKKWLSHDEFIDMVAIAESTPGPIAINGATYIGYKKSGFFGSLLATLGVILPSFIIILAISFFYEQFIKIEYVKYAFQGIQACVAFLILSAGIKMLKKLKMNVLNTILFSITLCGVIAFSLFFPQIEFSSIFYILIGGTIGLVVYLISYMKLRKKPSLKESDDKGEGQE